MEKLVNLRYLDMSGVPLTKMPLEIGRLKDIQFLSTFVVSTENGSSIEKLGKLYYLHGEFTISRLENVASGKNASMAKMKDKKYIQRLTLEWKGDSNDSHVVRDVLENLQPYNTNLEDLKIKGYGGTRFPDWLQGPSFCHLRHLHISECENCFCLPALGQLPSLKHLTLSGLSKVAEMDKAIHESRKPFPCLEELYIDDCPLLSEGIPNQIPSLKKLVISRCPGLVNSNGGLSIFDSSTYFSSLVELEIRSMPNLKELSSSELDLKKLLPCIEVLRITACEGIIMSFNRLPTALKRLQIWECGNLELELGTQELTQICHVSLASMKKLSLSLFPTLQSLFVLDMKELSFSIPLEQGNQNLTSLRKLDLRGCYNFVSFPVGGLPAPCLTHISLKRCPKLKSLPERMHTLLPSLQYLAIETCPIIERFPEGGLPCILEMLCVDHCVRLWSCHEEWGLQRLPSLTHLSLFHLQRQALLPEDFLLPATLTRLYLGENMNAKTLNCGVLQHLTCLQSLWIHDCPELSLLSGVALPASLSRLCILYCPLLKQRLEWKKGDDWPKVAHIPTIEVDVELIP